MKKVSQTKKIAFGGMISALSLIMMLASAVFPMAEYTCPALAGIFLCVLVIEFGKKTATIAFLAVAILSIIIVPNKESAMLFCGFLGYYPILKSVLESHNLFNKKSKQNINESFSPPKKLSRIIEWAPKIIIFNIAIVACYLVAFYVFGLKDIFSFEPLTSEATEGKFILSHIMLNYGTVTLLLIGNVAFVLYDIALTGLISAYCNRGNAKNQLSFGKKK